MAPQGCICASLAIQSRLFLVVISTSGSMDSACQFGALEFAPGLPGAATHTHWTWSKIWTGFLGPRSCRSRALVLKVGHARAGVGVPSRVESPGTLGACARHAWPWVRKTRAWDARPPPGASFVPAQSELQAVASRPRLAIVCHR